MTAVEMRLRARYYTKNCNMPLFQGSVGFDDSFTMDPHPSAVHMLSLSTYPKYNLLESEKMQWEFGKVQEGAWLQFSIFPSVSQSDRKAHLLCTLSWCVGCDLRCGSRTDKLARNPSFSC